MAAQELKGTSASAPLGCHECAFEECGNPLLTFPSTGGLQPSAGNASPPLALGTPLVHPTIWGGGCCHVWGRGAKGSQRLCGLGGKCGALVGGGAWKKLLFTPLLPPPKLGRLRLL